ncbi:hypothetical protein PHLGIDRAFT_182884 [Phlebiopsis gigantea 11061_1 CR5-6]|uniref:Uncharacterized protein n=1 Tax=Phlebiopsis gigantea (strain 11061_1 CR5-6) TaxID=745531 RepID=A0A0C3S3Z0_PHLG1|nr:hypothetical protein PHLGIDRAFT_182884 [Phlebiopsis gigantea 11061_1 CR5-6]
MGRKDIDHSASDERPSRIASFPQELLDHFMEPLHDDKKTVENASLTSKAFFAANRPQLFSRITLGEPQFLAFLDFAKHHRSQVRLTWRLTFAGTLYNAETYAPTVPNIFPVLYPCYPPSPLLRRLFDPVQHRRQLANPICEPPDEVVDKSWRRPRQKALDHVSSLFDILPNLSDLHANHLNVPDPAPLERPEFESGCLDSGIGRARGLKTFTIGDYSVCVPGDTWLRGLVAAAGASRLHALNLRSLRAKDLRD